MIQQYSDAYMSNAHNPNIRNEIFKSDFNVVKKKQMESFLEQHRVRGKDTFNTHVTMGDNTGKYNFSRNSLDEFWTLYDTGEIGKHICIAEKPQHTLPVLGDIDIKVKIETSPTNPIERLRSDQQTLEIIKVYQKVIKEIVYKCKKKHLVCILLEKPPYIDKSKNNTLYIKDGCHLHFPNLFLSKDEQDLHLIPRVRKYIKDLELFKNIGIEDSGSVIDPCCARVPWLLYGSCKSQGKDPYLVSKVFDHNGTISTLEKILNKYPIYNSQEKIIHFELTEIRPFLPRILSIIPYGREAQTLKEGLDLIGSTKPKTIKSTDFVNESNSDNQQIAKLVLPLLSDNRAEDLKEWLSVGWILHKVFEGDDEGFDLWNEFSKRCPEKYNEKECYNKWNNMSDKDGLTIGTLRYFAKIDNPNIYKTLKFKKQTKNEPDQPEEFEDDIDLDDLNLDCKEAETIYSPKIDNKKYSGKTYGEITRLDRGFANWICDNRSHPHDRYFCKILNRTYEPDESIPLDNIHPNESINQNNIGSYIPRLEKADIVCLRSNMMTYKTQNLKELFDIYKNVLIVSFRVSLEEEYQRIFGEYGFTLYSDFKGAIKDQSRLVVQIDSLYKVYGSYDLVIFDEMVYTKNHIHSFVKQKNKVWNTLLEYIQYTPKVIVCDALLDNATIDVFKQCNRSIHIVDNSYKSFSNKKVEIDNCNINIDHIIIDIIDNINKFGNVYFPTNSKTMAEKVALFLTKKNFKVGLMSSDTPDIKPEEWANYDCFITTPTTIAGVSCNTEFGKTIAYFTNISCSAEMSSQMLFRVRNTKCDTMKIYIKEIYNGFTPTNKEEILKYILEKDNLIYESGLHILHTRERIIEDDYFTSYINYMKQKNLSKICFRRVLRGVLEAHGIVVLEQLETPEEIKLNFQEETKISNDICKQIDVKSTDEIKIDVATLKKAKKEEECKAISEAKDISKNEYTRLSEQYKKRIEEKYQLRKFIIQQNYNKQSFDAKFVEEFEPIMTQYKNVNLMNTEHLQLYIETKISEFIKEHKNDNNTSRLHEKHSLLKIWTAHNIIKLLGFNNIFDTRKIDGFPYKACKDFLISYNDKLSILFGTKKKDWKDVNVDDQKDKKLISRQINSLLKSVCNITVNKTVVGKNNAISNDYKIKGLDIWEKGKVPLIKNQEAETIYNESKVFKRILVPVDYDCVFPEISDDIGFGIEYPTVCTKYMEIKVKA